jgi:hypothetical protein
VARFFFQERLKLADAGLSQIDDVHDGWKAAAGVARKHDSWQREVNEARRGEQQIR